MESDIHSPFLLCSSSRVQLIWVQGRASIAERKRKFAMLLPAPQDSRGTAEVTESFLDPALSGVLTGNSTALPARAGLKLCSGNVSRTSSRIKVSVLQKLLSYQITITFAKLLRVA